MVAGALRFADRWSAVAVRSRRGPKEPVDPWRPLAVLSERERVADGGTRGWLTVFVAGAECPFTCVFCDLWRQTLDGPTPPGAVPAQVAAALERPAEGPSCDGIKLYNASNFFEERAVPVADDPALLAALAPFDRVLVECHPRLIGRRALAWAEALAARGAVLEVAMGLETIHPQAMPRLGKSLDREGFEAAAATLLAAGAAVRAFVLVGAPWVPAVETVAWTVATAQAAVAAGATHVSLIPVRGGNGALEELARRGDWTAPSLADLEAAVDRCLVEVEPAGAVVLADLWDLDELAACPACGEERRARIERINVTGRPQVPIACAACGGSAEGGGAGGERNIRRERSSRTVSRDR